MIIIEAQFIIRSMGLRRVTSSAALVLLGKAQTTATWLTVCLRGDVVRGCGVMTNSRNGAGGMEG